MQKKTVFISSTYKDLKEYRRMVWDALKAFSVTVRGMEAFGARTTKPLETCLAEVEQADVYVGIIAYRLGSIDPQSKKPYTFLEYERAVEQKKEILIYLADDETASFPYAVVDKDGSQRERLQAFKEALKSEHTVGTFSTVEDLSEKLTREFSERFAAMPSKEQAVSEDVYAKTVKTLTDFRLRPKRYNGYEIRLEVQFFSSVFPASRHLCQQFNLEYGNTVGGYFNCLRPKERDVTSGFREMFATGNKIDRFVAAVDARTADLHAQLQFSEEDVRSVKAEFLGHSYYDDGDWGHDPNEIWVPPEGKVILLYAKQA
jgi:hypothetical protein